MKFHGHRVSFTFDLNKANYNSLNGYIYIPILMDIVPDQQWYEDMCSKILEFNQDVKVRSSYQLPHEVCMAMSGWGS